MDAQYHSLSAGGYGGNTQAAMVRKAYRELRRGFNF
jgi:hypothetical protein